MTPKTKILLLLLGAGFPFVLIPQITHAVTYVSGDIFASETWYATSSPYIVQNTSGAGGVRLTSGATLTIEPGVVVKFETGAQLYNQSGKIIAEGTQVQPIIFTSLLDDTVSGDTNGDGSATSPSAGAWFRIALGGASDSIQYTEIRYATGCLGIGESATVKNNLIENCTTGIDIGYATSTLMVANNTIRNNQIGIRFLASTGVSFSGNNITGNTNYGAYNITGLQSQYSVTANGNWWGNAAGPCPPASQPACASLGDKITDGFIITTSLGAAYSATPATTAARSDPLAGASAGQQISKAAIPPKILKFQADPPQGKEGDSEGVNLSWETDFVDFVKLEGYGEVATSGEMKVYPDRTQTYRLIAVGPGGQKIQELEVRVAPRDPVIIIPGILGSAAGWKGELVLDPLLHTYDGLWEGLKNVDYQEGVNLFAFPYDWRQDNRFTAVELDKKIEEVRRICHCQKVDLVAHSMGGLVARYYIQHINDQTVDQVIFLGTPAPWSPKSILGLGGGRDGTILQGYICRKVA